MRCCWTPCFLDSSVSFATRSLIWCTAGARREPTIRSTFGPGCGRGSGAGWYGATKANDPEAITGGSEAGTSSIGPPAVGSGMRGDTYPGGCANAVSPDASSAERPDSWSSESASVAECGGRFAQRPPPVRVGCKHLRYWQACFFTPAPPNLGLSLQLGHFPQSARLHPSHAPVREAWRRALSVNTSRIGLGRSPAIRWLASLACTCPSGMAAWAKRGRLNITSCAGSGDRAPHRNTRSTFTAARLDGARDMWSSG